MAPSTETAQNNPTSSATKTANNVTYETLMRAVKEDVQLRDDFRYVAPADRLDFSPAPPPKALKDYLPTRLRVGESYSYESDVYAYVHRSRKKQQTSSPNYNGVTYVLGWGETVNPEAVVFSDHFANVWSRAEIMPAYFDRIRFMILFYYLEKGHLGSFPEFKGHGIGKFKKCCDSIAGIARHTHQPAYRSDITMQANNMVDQTSSAHTTAPLQETDTTGSAHPGTDRTLLAGAPEHSVVTPAADKVSKTRTPSTSIDIAKDVNTSSEGEIGTASEQNTTPSSQNPPAGVQDQSTIAQAPPASPSPSSKKRSRETMEDIIHDGTITMEGGHSLHYLRQFVDALREEACKKVKTETESLHSKIHELEVACATAVTGKAKAEEKSKEMANDTQRYCTLINDLEKEKNKERSDRIDTEFRLYDLKVRRDLVLKESNGEIEKLRTQVAKLDEEKQVAELELQRLRALEGETAKMLEEKKIAETENQKLQEELKGLREFKAAVLAVTSNQ
ncbi:uncharacterized protein EI97DRAFT_457404 [Westerdykella ornata]|uniref:Uncharacterized protein n=1 Tax=Westerdykella ornata TaxID=318751 RepID=A0A6A6JQZ1_WESOR|nr:uncharacterized protein EI97DRAFT_457404 [Westerdykella ornata]KAF2277379.1 hypothetical protein EI97DRAFT_457404 [Westerdykella ornata]